MADPRKGDAEASPARRNPSRQSKSGTRDIYRVTRSSARVHSPDPLTTKGPKYQARPDEVSRRSKRKRNWRQRSYVDDDEDEDEDKEEAGRVSDSPSGSVSTSTQSSNKKPRRPYKLSDDVEPERAQPLPHMWSGPTGDDESDDEDDDELPDSQKNVRSLPSSPDTALKTTPRKRQPRRAKKTAVKKQLGQKQVAGRSESGTQEPVIPNWKDSRIEYSIWVCILQYAATTVYGGLDINWLLRTARASSILTEPALTVLYRCPPLPNEQKAAGLARLLALPLSQLKFNYRAKIESLCVDVSFVSLGPDYLASPGRLIQNLPRLSELHLVTRLDNPPYRQLEEALRWQYSSDIFRALGVSPVAQEEHGDKMRPTRLKSWKWNERMMGKGFVNSFAKIREIHSTPSFAHLRRICFVNYQVPSWGTNKDFDDPEVLAKDSEYVKSLAGALSVLKALDHLAFESSTAVNATLLPLLPRGLKHLELINCWEVCSDDFGEFLLSHGGALETLRLHHNQALNLAFFTVLGTACTRLRELRMNLLYFRHHEAYHDSDPFYDHLILQDQVPQWPHSLVVVDLDNLRRWSIEAAMMFFQSFIDSAERLTDLRHLSIKSMLNIPWRQRSGFRMHWQEKLEEVFLRHSEPPQQIRSIRDAPVEDKEHLTALIKKPKAGHSAKPSRQSRRLATQQDNDPVARGRRKSAGLRSLGRTKYEEPDSDEFDNESDPDEQMTDSGPESGESTDMEGGVSSEVKKPFIQGRCTVVEVKLDNQKPTEHQYVMDDFLDAPSDESDAEWDGQAEYE